MKMDLRYGGEFLGGVKRTKYENQGARDIANTDYAAMPYLFDNVIEEDDVIADVGSGKGRVLNYLLHKFPNTKLYGLELDPECAGSLSRRLRRYKSVNVLCGNACELIPPDANVFYLFNPFNRPVMEKFKQAIERSDLQGRRNRPIKIIYYNAVHAEVFAADTRFAVEPIQLPQNLHPAVLIRHS
jgi:hypothetical protein